MLAIFADRLIRALLARRAKAGPKRDPIDGSAPHPSDGSGDAPDSGLWRRPPHPGWRPGQKLPPPYPEEFMHAVDPSVTPSDVLYPLIISAVVPRPVAFVSTLSAQGGGNLAPYSYFNVLAHNPPHVAIGFCTTGLRAHRRKDSLVNILETGCAAHVSRLLRSHTLAVAFLPRLWAAFSDLAQRSAAAAGVFGLLPRAPAG